MLQHCLIICKHF